MKENTPRAKLKAASQEERFKKLERRFLESLLKFLINLHKKIISGKEDIQFGHFMKDNLDAALKNLEAGKLLTLMKFLENKYI